MQWEHWKGRRNEDDQQQICHLCCCDFVLFDETAKNLKYISACYWATLLNTLQNFCIPAQSSWSDCMTDNTESGDSRQARLRLQGQGHYAQCSWYRDEPSGFLNSRWADPSSVPAWSLSAEHLRNHEDIQSLPCHCCDHGQCNDEHLWPTTGQVMTLIPCLSLIFKSLLSQLKIPIHRFCMYTYTNHFRRFRKYNFLLPPSFARPRTYRPPLRIVTTTTQGPVFEFDQKSSFDLAPSGYTLTLLLLGKKNLEREYNESI